MPKQVALALTVILIWLGNIVPASAQTGFEVVTYDNRSGIVQRIDANSSILDSFQLPLPEGYSNYSPIALTDRTHSYIAYHVSSEDRERFQFMVYRYSSDPQIVVAYHIDYFINDNLSGSTQAAQVFSKDEQVVYAFTSLENGFNNNQWTMLVFDLASGEVAYRLEAEDFLVGREDTITQPTPFTIERSKVTFQMVPFASLQTQHFNVYVWDLQDNTARLSRFELRRQHDRSGSIILDTLQDSTLRPPAVAFDINQRHDTTNSLALYVNEDQHTILYQDPDVAFSEAYFVQDGARVLARTESPGAGSHWLLIDPDGALVSSTPAEQAALPLDFYSLRSVTDGFVYTVSDSLFHVDTTTGTLTPRLLASEARAIIGTTGSEASDQSAYMALQPQFDEDARWTTALYDSTLQRLWIVNSRGQVLLERSLPLPTDAALGFRSSPAEAVQFPSVQVASDGGDRLAYTLPVTFHGDKYLLVYDIAQDRLLLNSLLPENSSENNLNVSPAVFSPSGNTLYFGYSPSWVWQLEQIALDPEGEHSAVRATLRGDDPRFAEMTVIDMEGNHYPYFPITLIAEDDRVVFTFGTSATNTEFHARILEWRPAEDVITYVNDKWINPHQVEGCWHTPCAGHVLMTGFDDHFGFLDDFRLNMFQVFRQVDNALFSFYTSAVASPSRAFFVQNGTLILVSQNMRDVGASWSVLRRTGFPEIERWTPPETVYGVIGTQPGWLYTTASSALYESIASDLERPAEPIVKLLARALHFLWIHEPDSTEFPMTDLWGNIVRLFQPGDRVVVTTAGNQLRMRVTPAGEVQRQFNAGAVVTIVGGPTEVAQMVWWQVRDENGMVGWVAERNSQANYLALAL